MSCSACHKVKGFTQSISTWVGAGLPVAKSESINNRRILCQACEHFNGHLCTKCGCLMAVKIRMATAECPVGKW
jgi:hypothetical protein